MRTVPECAHYLKIQDPGTCIGEYYLRCLVKNGEIPHHAAGRKILLNLDALEYFLDNPPVAKVEPSSYGKIRKIGI